MPLIAKSKEKVFDETSIRKGDLIRAEYEGWDKPRNGIVTNVKKDKLTVLFLPEIGNVTSYYTILAQEVAEDKWEVRWTEDLETINTVELGEGEGAEEGEEE